MCLRMKRTVRNDIVVLRFVLNLHLGLGSRYIMDDANVPVRRLYSFFLKDASPLDDLVFAFSTLPRLLE